MGEQLTPLGPDLGAGAPLRDLPEGVAFAAQAHGEALVALRRGDEVLALAAACSHYGGPLREGLIEGNVVRCPWHHACFDMRTGEAVGAPALDDVACYAVDVHEGVVRLGKKRDPKARPTGTKGPSSVVIVGAGAAGAACAEELRKRGYDGPVHLVGAEPPAPVDRPNLSKDYLAGTAPEEWLWPHDAAFYRERSIELAANDPVVSIDPDARAVRLSTGRKIPYGALLLAPGAEPIRLPIDGMDRPHVFTLRSLADTKNVLGRAASAKRVVVIGTSFIGLEAAASLCQRGLDVTVVGPDAVPLGRVLGDEVGAFVKRVHEARGVTFRLGRRPSVFTSETVRLDDGTELPTDLVIVGVGVKPRVGLAEGLDLAADNGILTDEQLRTSMPDVYAAGDVARFPYDGGRARIEHWVVAQRQGQAVARAMLGSQEPFKDVPFFWSAHYDVTLRYVGHAERFDKVTVRGDLDKRDACVSYEEGGRARAVVTVGRDKVALEAEAALGRNDAAALQKLLEAQ